MIGRLVVGVIVSTGVSAAGWRASALSGHGAIAAVGVGTGIAGGASWPGMVVLGTFFVSSSALSRSRRPTGVEAKGSRRDERQVLANGAAAAIGALLGGRVDRRLGLALAAGSLSAATADTWATELGSQSPAAPRLILSGRTVNRGISGGVTSRGLIAALGGAATIGVVTGVMIGLTSGRSHAWRIGSAVVVTGIAGSLADSFLGETVQERRQCPVCGVRTEARVHSCGVETTHTGGVRGFDNDLVNLACTAIGGVLVAPFLAGARSSSDGPGPTTAGVRRRQLECRLKH